jgi:hypothetical protein
MLKMIVLTTYTLFKRADFQDDHVIARGLSAAEAMSHIVESVDGRNFQISEENYEHFRRFDWDIFNGNADCESWTLHATVPIADDYNAERNAALEIIGSQFIRIAHKYWDGSVQSDVDFDEGLQYAADREDAGRMEREIAATFVSVLAQSGYTMARDIVGNDFALVRPADRDELCKFVFESLVGDLTVFKTGVTHRFGFNFGGDGWDIIEDHSGVLRPLIEAVIDPYRSKGHPAKVARIGIDNFRSIMPKDSVTPFIS